MWLISVWNFGWVVVNTALPTLFHSDLASSCQRLASCGIATVSNWLIWSSVDRSSDLSRSKTTFRLFDSPFICWQNISDFSFSSFGSHPPSLRFTAACCRKTCKISSQTLSAFSNNLSQWRPMRVPPKCTDASTPYLERIWAQALNVGFVCALAYWVSLLNILTTWLFDNKTNLESKSTSCWLRLPVEGSMQMLKVCISSKYSSSSSSPRGLLSSSISKRANPCKCSGSGERANSRYCLSLVIWLSSLVFFSSFIMMLVSVCRKCTSINLMSAR